MLKKGMLVKHKFFFGLIGIVTRSLENSIYCEVYWQLNPKFIGLTSKSQKRVELRAQLESIVRGKKDIQER